MDLRPSLQIKTVIKALTDVVLPAVDPDNKLAQEQAKLAIGMLQIIEQRQPLMYRFDIDELTRFLALAETLRQQAEGLPGVADALSELNESAKAGSEVLSRARAEPSELEDANFALREKVGAFVSKAYAGNDFARLKPISQTINAHAKEQLLRERVWLVAQGWEPDAKSLPTIEALIGDRPAAR
jgi:hypothetical protein